MSRRYSLRRPPGLRIGQMDRRNTRRAEREKQRHRQGPDVLQGEYPIGNRIYLTVDVSSMNIYSSNKGIDLPVLLDKFFKYICSIHT